MRMVAIPSILNHFILDGNLTRIFSNNSFLFGREKNKIDCWNDEWMMEKKRSFSKEVGGAFAFYVGLASAI